MFITISIYLISAFYPELVLFTANWQINTKQWHTWLYTNISAQYYLLGACHFLSFKDKCWQSNHLPVCSKRISLISLCDILDPASRAFANAFRKSQNAPQTLITYVQFSRHSVGKIPRNKITHPQVTNQPPWRATWLPSVSRAAICLSQLPAHGP